MRPEQPSQQPLLARVHSELRSQILSYASPQEAVKGLQERFPRQSWRPERRLGGHISYFDSHPEGSTPPSHTTSLVILPGLFDVGESFLPELATLSNACDMRVVVMEYAQMGSFTDFKKHAPEFLQSLGIGDVMLYGTSLGGILAQHLAQEDSLDGRVKGMILSHTALPSSKQFATRKFASLGFGKFLLDRLPSAVVSRIGTGLVGSSLGITLPEREAADANDFLGMMQCHIDRGKSFVKQVPKNVASTFMSTALEGTRSSRGGKGIRMLPDTPVCWVSSQDDPVMLHATDEEIAAFYPNLTRHCFPTGGHATFAQQRVSLWEKIVPFVEQHVSSH